ncbi:3-methyl-2-oxobutanoate hydroxymethyltransferase [Halalkalibacillus halophilus]|uniref:3-methyl-2-oxobutanoate hydroxymethyltransferase n=1 Tax=Halalkalibacillus halophilus TaxID=392827 RepID=UPI00040F4785|nr:3-methyl-2-oxobutanoate hydroxymethyltransferase [Halalkalibacillus halophilus]
MLSHTNLLKAKENNEKLAMVTAYDYPSAKLSEQAGVDFLLVGDSLGMVVLGYDSTIKVTVEDMIHHGKAVKRGAPNTYLVVDMPFMSYQVSEEEALNNAKKIFQAIEPQALKLEGGSEIIPTVKRFLTSGIPVVGHIGLTPQSFNVLGGYKVQGKSEEQAQQLIKDAKELEAAGVVALVLECIPAKLAAYISNELTIPTIGIGAGNGCDGQVLVYHDLLTYGVDRLAKFVKPYMDTNKKQLEALEQYINEVKAQKFPADEHTFKIDDAVIDRLYGGKNEHN